MAAPPRRFSSLGRSLRDILSTLLFPYDLPPSRIAQRPVAPGASALLHARCAEGGSGVSIADRRFADLPEILLSGDLLVLNNSKVLPTRFFPAGFTEKAEVLLLQPRETAMNTAESSQTNRSQDWEALARPMKKFERAQQFALSAHLHAEVLGRNASGEALRLRISSNEPSLSVEQCIELDGRMPIPPYIRQGRADEEDSYRYQTVYAEVGGSVAAPTAGLHFTPRLFEQLRASGIEYQFVTHHVGPASFLPVRDGEWDSHIMNTELYSISAETINAVTRCKKEGRRVVAVGTTTVRALESYFETHSFDVHEESAQSRSAAFASTQLFITPGFEFKVIDALITNFHQPLSTHLLLVAAFSGIDQCRTMYEHALAGSYRFLSYGDAMFIELPEKPMRGKLGG